MHQSVAIQHNAPLKLPPHVTTNKSSMAEKGLEGKSYTQVFAITLRDKETAHRFEISTNLSS